METGAGGDPARKLQEEYARYKVYDRHYDEIGRVDDLFVDESDRPEYIGVKMGFLGTKSTLIPMDIARVNDRRELIEVAESKDVIEGAPSFGVEEEITPDQEAEIRTYYGLERLPQRDDSPYGGYGVGQGTGVDLEYGERVEGTVPGYERPPEPEMPAAGEQRIEEPVGQEPVEHEPIAEEPIAEEPVTRQTRDAEVRDEDEVRVQRTEEELRAGTREREAGSVNVRKRVRTDREQVRVPRRREEVTVERVPASESPGDAGGTSGGTSGGAPGAGSEEEEIRIPVVEEEVVVEKRPVVKEEIRIRKNVVEEEAVVEEDVRKEEIEVDDETKRGR